MFDFDKAEINIKILDAWKSIKNIPLAERALKSEHRQSRDFWTDMSELLHMVKRGDMREITRNLGDRPKCENEIEFVRLCIMATHIEYSMKRKGLEVFEWVKSADLYLSEPYIADETPDLALFFCPQESLSHNVILMDSAFEVL